MQTACFSHAGTEQPKRGSGRDLVDLFLDENHMSQANGPKVLQHEADTLNEDEPLPKKSPCTVEAHSMDVHVPPEVRYASCGDCEGYPVAMHEGL